MSESVIKLEKKYVEEYLNQPLHEGANIIRKEIKVNRSTLHLTYSLICPSNQTEETAYVFLLVDSLIVEGRGKGTYGEDIIEETLFEYREMQVHDIFSSRPDKEDQKKLLAGFRLIEKEEVEYEYEAVYATIHFIDFQKETSINLTDTDVRNRSYSTSAEEHLFRYFLDDVRYNRKEVSSKMLFNGSIYQYEANFATGEGNTYIASQYEDLRSRKNHEEFFLIDNQSRLWRKVASYKEKNHIEAEFKSLRVVVNSLYSLEELFSRLNEESDYILLENKLYVKINQATVMMEAQELIPFMKTNLSAHTPLKGSGLYSTILLDGVQTVIVPIEKDYILSHYGGFSLVVVDGVIYTVVGNSEEIGFTERDYRERLLEVSTRPENDYQCFYESPTEINLHDYEKNHFSFKIELEIYNEAFKNKETTFTKGNSVLITKELKENSQLKGLEGTLISLSHNKAKATVKFFNHFEESFPVGHLKVAK